jgi:IS5 family transposase
VGAAAGLIEPHYPKAGQGRQPLGLEKMLRIYFVQQWFNLSDPQAEDAIYGSESMRRFARVELGEEVVPDETTILRLSPPARAARAGQRDLRRDRGAARGAPAVSAGRDDRGRDIIAAPSSTKNASATRDPEMKQTRKGQNWHFGMKLHIAVDKRGIVHTVTATNAVAADISQLPALLHGQECEVCGDQAYWKEADRLAYKARGVRYRINRRPHPSAPLSARWKQINCARLTTRNGRSPRARVQRLLSLDASSLTPILMTTSLNRLCPPTFAEVP